MIRDITLGQYYPGNSILHKTDPRIKLICLPVFFAVLFIVTDILPLIATLALTAVLCIMSQVNGKLLLKSLKPLIFILIFTAVINLFFVETGEILFEFYFIRIHTDGIKNAITVFLRLISLVAGTSVLLSFTTSPFDLSDALERLLKPLAMLGLKVHDFSMMMTIALRFIPTLAEETDKIISAQKARGADFESGSLIKRAKALVPIIVPLFVSAFRRADELAEAMECRCYNGGCGHTKLNTPHLKIGDFVFLLLFVCACVGIILLEGVELPWLILQ